LDLFPVCRRNFSAPAIVYAFLITIQRGRHSPPTILGFGKPRTLTDILSRSFNIMQRHSDLAWRTQADIIIEPDVKQFVWDDFTKTPDMVAAGEIAALHALPQIRAALKGERRDSTPGSDLTPASLK